MLQVCQRNWNEFSANIRSLPLSNLVILWDRDLCIQKTNPPGISKAISFMPSSAKILSARSFILGKQNNLCTSACTNTEDLALLVSMTQLFILTSKQQITLLRTRTWKCLTKNTGGLRGGWKRQSMFGVRNHHSIEEGDFATTYQGLTTRQSRKFLEVYHVTIQPRHGSPSCRQKISRPEDVSQLRYDTVATKIINVSPDD